MKSLIIILTFLFVTSCGMDQPDMQPYKDQRLEDIRLEFINFCFEYKNEKCLQRFPQNNISAVKKNSMDNSKKDKISGRCDLFQKENIVYIDEQYLIYPDFLRSLVFHEMGHCLLDAKHGTSYLMQSTLVGELHDKDDWKDAVIELFETNQ